MGNESGCKGAAQGAVVSVVYDRSIHATASHVTQKKTVPMGGCSASPEGADMNPIDLMAMGLAGCILIVMGKAADAEKLDIKGAKADVSYGLVNYRITEFKVDIFLPRGFDAAQQARLEAASKTCPLSLAISPEVKVALNFNWPACVGKG